MKLNTIFLISLILILFPFNNLIAAEVVKQYEDWKCVKSKDKMRNTVNYYIYTKSKNTLEGWLNNGKLLFGYDDGFYMRATDLGFHTDRYISGNSQQTILLKVDDDNKLFKYATIIWDDNNDGLSFASNYNYTDLINKMKKGYELDIEIVLFQTDGKEQIAHFSLMGFTKAYNCIKRKK